MDRSSIKSNCNKPSMLTSLQFDSHGNLIRMYRSMSTPHQALGSVLEKTASDLVALQLLSLTQRKVHRAVPPMTSRHGTRPRSESAKLIRSNHE